MKTYYIYHIPGVKIGCTIDIEKRINAQKYTQWEILEEHTDIAIAGIREQELQKQYGYKVDTISYSQTINNANYKGRSKGGKTQGVNNVKSGLLKSIRSLGGIIGGNKIARENPNHFKNMSKLGSKKGANATKHKKEYAILVYRYDTNEYIGEYPNQTEAANHLKLHSQNIGSQLNGKAKHTGGYTFNYKNKV
jgi:hypothetical protein